RVLGEFLDRIAPVLEDPLVAVNVGDAAATRRGIHEGGMVGLQSGVVSACLDLPQVRRADRALGHRDFVLLAGAVVSNRQRIGHRRGRVFQSELESGSGSGSELLSGAGSGSPATR